MAAASTYAPLGVVVVYEEVVESPERILRELGPELGVSVEQATVDEFAEYVNQEAHHRVNPASGSDPALVQLAGDIWFDLRGDHRPGLAAVLPGIASGSFDVVGYPGVREMADLHRALERARAVAAPLARKAVGALAIRVENRQLRLDRDRIARDLHRLAQRRSVRAARAAASLTSPGFRLVRRARERL